jgi:hypothetical protein
MTKGRFLILGMALADLSPWGNAVVRVDGVIVRLVKDFIIGGSGFRVTKSFRYAPQLRRGTFPRHCSGTVCRPLRGGGGLTQALIT